MKDLLKIVAKKLFIWSIVINTIYSFADYGESFALSYFGTSPLLLNKLIILTILLMSIELIKLITGKIGSYIDNINETEIQTSIEKYLKNKTYIIVTHRPKLKDLCNKHYIFENHMLKEVVNTY